MSSDEYLRKLINDRLSAAAAEIFGAFKNVIIEYEEELYRQGRLLSVYRKPEIKLHKIELPLRRVCEDREEVPTDPEQEDSEDDTTDPEKDNTEEDLTDSEQEDPKEDLTDPKQEDPEEDHSDPEQENPEEDLTDPKQEDPEEDHSDPEQEDPKEDLTDPKQEDPEEDHSDPEQEDPEKDLTDPKQEDPEEDHSDPEQEDPEEVLTDPKQENPEEHFTDPEQEDPAEDLTDSQQEDPGSLQTKGKQNELHTNQEGDQFVEKPETHKENDQSKEETLSLNPDEPQGEAQKECSVNSPASRSVVGDPTSDQLLSKNSHVAKRRGQTGGKCKNDSEIPFKKKRLETTDRLYVCQTCGQDFQTRSEFSDHMGIHTKLLVQCILKEKELHDEQQLRNQERNSAADKKDSDSPHIKEQLGEIGAFQNIVECVEVDYQRALLGVVRKLEIKLHRMEPPLRHVCRKDEVLAEQQVLDHEWNFTMDPEDPKPSQMKEEEAEPCTSQEEEELIVKEETNAFMFTPTHEEKTTRKMW